MSEVISFHFLQTETLPSLPPTIKVLSDWGEISILTKEVGTVSGIVVGRHLHVEAKPEDIQAWIGSNHLWMGIGNPMLQNFEIAHLKKAA